MKTIAIVAAALALSACSSFRLGSMLYVPNGATATFSVGEQAKAASAP